VVFGKDWDLKWDDEVDSDVSGGNAGVDERKAVGLSMLAIPVDCSDDAVCFSEALFVIVKATTNSRTDCKITACFGTNHSFCAPAALRAFSQYDQEF
jgi:hypothetical protein